MSNASRRLPGDMMARKKRVPVSTRVLEQAVVELRKQAQLHGMSLGELAANILEDYVEWLLQNSSGPDKAKSSKRDTN